MEKILVISVHPDDETLGCGGTILKHKNNGDQIYCAFVTGGNKFQKKLIKELVNKYRFNEFFEMNFDELILDDISLNDLIPAFVAIFNGIQPNILYIPNRSDIHSDHRRIFDAVIAASKSFRAPFIKKILMCEVMSETDFAPALHEKVFLPNVFIDITETFEQKLDIVKLFESELMPEPYTRSISAIEALSRYRGSQINVKYAESFMLIKEIQ